MNIIFDLDGTLLDVSQRHYVVYMTIIEKHGGKPLSKEVYWRMKRSKDSWEKILEFSMLKIEFVTSFLEEFITLIESPRMTDLDRLFEASVPTLTKLHENKHRMFLVSLRRNNTIFENEIKHLGIRKYFDEIVSAHTQNEGYELKSKIFLKISDDPRTVIIGDTEADIMAAHKIGYTSVAVLSGIRNEVILKLLKPDHIIDDVSRLPELIEGI